MADPLEEERRQCYLVARVGFEEMFYEVNETTGIVEICVVVYEPDIDCPIQMEFTVSIETRAETAGTCMYIPILLLTLSSYGITFDWAGAFYVCIFT